VALIAGWYTTEIGRQPWLAGTLPAADAASKVVAPKDRAGHFHRTCIGAALIVAYVSVVFYPRAIARMPTSLPGRHGRHAQSGELS
jgi:cytochrome bd-type quinol oxidase subunit 1